MCEFLKSDGVGADSTADMVINSLAMWEWVLYSYWEMQNLERNDLDAYA